MNKQIKISKYQQKRIQKQAQQEAELCELYDSLYPKQIQEEPKNQDYFKPYLRLTQQVDFSNVRPLNILKEALTFFQQQYIDQTIDYSQFNEQMRSIRQDLSVLNSEDLFTLKVYETNAILSIENYDLQTYEICQSQLYKLYDLGLTSENQNEMLCYMIIYNCLKGNKDYVIKLLNTLSLDEQNDLVYFALNLCTYVQTHNYYKIFRCYYLGSNKMIKMIKPFLENIKKQFIKEQQNSFFGKNSEHYFVDIGWNGNTQEYRCFCDES